MATTPARARKWTQRGKTVGRRNKVGLFYVQLLREPSGYDTQEIVVEVDRGEEGRGQRAKGSNMVGASNPLPIAGDQI